MRWRLHRFTLTKEVPLTISRGTTGAVEHLLLELEAGGCMGRGETGGFDTGQRHFTTQALEAELQAWLPALDELDLPPPAAWPALLEPLSPPARCAVDLALHDCWGQQLGQPLWRLWGLARSSCRPTSVTLGLGSVDLVLQRLERWRSRLPATRVKLKLGSPDGLDHDCALVEAVLPQLQGAELQVDANGGWSLEIARKMLPWLAERGVVLVEQPLAAAVDDEQGFADLQGLAPIPLVADESCWGVEDLLRLAPHVQGVNLKLLKTGGLGEAWLMARLARRLGLQLMLGCYSDSALLNGAAAQLLPLVEWPDLDSHLNLIDDPFYGPLLDGDLLQPGDGLGLGVSQC
ncbi:MAG: dipeptide epimerase [Synechococcus sp. TMED19]|nr:MAG: dipeptide epimerase [Synechococcus sp. TMED19]